MNIHKNIIVTGALGFVGSNLIKGLIREFGHLDLNILALDNCSTGNPDNLKSVQYDGLHIVNVDLSDYYSVHNFYNKYDTTLYTLCFHLAASIGVKEIHDKPKQSFNNSKNINDNIITLLSESTKIIYSSTSEVYGESEVLGSDEYDNLKIINTHSNRSTYSSSKLYSEHLLRSNFDDVCIVRFFNIIGETQKPDYGHVIPNFLLNAKLDKDIVVHDDGQSLRSYCYIDDAVNMLCGLIYNDVEYEEIYNVGCEENVITTLRLANKIIKLTNSKSKIVHIPFKEMYPNGDQIYIRHPITKRINNLMTKLDRTKPSTTLDDIILNIAKVI